MLLNRGTCPSDLVGRSSSVRRLRHTLELLQLHVSQKGVRCLEVSLDFGAEVLGEGC